MPPGKTQWSYGYPEIARLVGLSENAIQQHVTRGRLNPGNLKSLLMFIAGHGPIELRAEIMAAALGGSVPRRKRPSRKSDR